MKPFLKRALAALFSLMLIVSAALALPLMMDQLTQRSLATQVVFAQEETPQEEDITPTPSPLPIAAYGPAQEEDPSEAPVMPTYDPGNTVMVFPTPSPVAGIIPIENWPGATPMPPAGQPEGSSLAQPLSWRKLLTPIATKGAEMWAAKLKTLDIFGCTLGPDSTIASFYLLPGDDSPNLVESLQPKELSLQKLLQGILTNLDSQPIYVPGKEVLERVMNLPISSVLLPADGNHSLFLATNAQRLPLAVLSALSSQGKRTVAYSEYTGQRNLMVLEAQKLLSLSPDTAMDKSAALVQELMKGDQPWQLSVIQMTPYACNEFWDYYLAGHHVKAVDMETGDQVILTTDLISGKVVGFTREEGEPYLLAYQKLLTEAERRGNVSQDSLDEVRRAGTAFASYLAETDLNSGNWAITTAEAVNVPFNVQVPTWEVQFNHADEEAQLLDPSGAGIPMEYKVRLNENHELIAWSAYPIVQASSGQGIGMNDAGFDEKLNLLLQNKNANNSALISRVQYIATNRDQLLIEALQKLSHLYPGAMLKEANQIFLDDLTFQDGSLITQVSFVLTFITPEGKTLSVTALMMDDDTVRITNLIDLDAAGQTPQPVKTAVPAGAHKPENPPQDDESRAKEIATVLGSQLAQADLGDAGRWPAFTCSQLMSPDKVPVWTTDFSHQEQGEASQTPGATQKGIPVSYRIVLNQAFEPVLLSIEPDFSSSQGTCMCLSDEDINTQLGSMFSSGDTRQPAVTKRVKEIASSPHLYLVKMQKELQDIFPGAVPSGDGKILVEEMRLQDNRIVILIFFEKTFALPDGRMLKVTALINEDDSVKVFHINDASMTESDLIPTP